MLSYTILIAPGSPDRPSPVVVALASVAPRVRLCIADCAESFAYLSGAGKYSNRDEHPVPQLVILDIDTATESAFAMMRGLRTTGFRLDIPVICITRGGDRDLIDHAYRLGANSCILKNEDDSALEEIAVGIADYAALLKRDARPLANPARPHIA